MSGFANESPSNIGSIGGSRGENIMLIQCEDCGFIAPEEDLILGGDPSADGYCGPQCSVCDGQDFVEFEGYEVDEYAQGMNDAMHGKEFDVTSNSYAAGYASGLLAAKLEAVTE